MPACNSPVERRWYFTYAYGPDLWRAARNPQADPTNLSFTGKAVLVTGANSGLGLAAAIKYAAQGASPLILGVRSPEKGERAKAAITKAARVQENIFVVLTVDLASFASVRAFARAVSERVPRLHVVQLAGGVAKVNYEPTADGYESALQVNVLSPGILGLLLLPKLRETAASLPGSESVHMSFVNGVAHQEVKVADLAPDQSLIQRANDQEKLDFQKQYFLVKLVEWFMTKGVAEWVAPAEKSRIVVNANCPGLCKTNMLHELPLAASLAMPSPGRMTHIHSMSEPPPGELLASERGTSLYKETWNEALDIFRKHLGPDIV
ncbi:putative Short-chain dehydrogenase [Seiridium cardinale]|uniref:Short-chain dehydrogenase n=1 Tax=Seiridium cardinale TaxID=138064 RepID=A0ABR2X851_9PEZI